MSEEYIEADFLLCSNQPCWPAFAAQKSQKMKISDFMMYFRKFGLAFALSCAVLFKPTGVEAAFVNYVIGDGGLEVFNITWDGTTENGLVGGIKLTQQYAAGPNHQSGMPQVLYTVCTDVGGTLFLGYPYGYTQPQAFNGHTGVDPNWGSGNQNAVVNSANAAAAIQAAADVFYHHSSVLSLGNTTDKAALQLAVWEALYDTVAGSSTYSLQQGRFKANSGDGLAITEAQLWLSQVNPNATYAGSLLIPDPIPQYGLPPQEVLYNITPVPEPTTLIAGALLMVPMGISGFRRLRGPKNLRS
jgi:hypothetical protein